MTTTVTTRPTLTGNKLVLVGALLYLLEFVGILGTGLDSLMSLRVAETDVLGMYDGSTGRVGFLAGWMSVVLLGRILLFVGLRSALTDSGRAHAVMDWAVVAAAVSVTLEVASHGVAVSAARLAETGRDEAVIITNHVAAGLGFGMMAGLAVATLASAYAMARSGLFSRLLVGIGALAGLGMLGAQLTAGSLDAVSEQLTIAVMLFWVWMLWTGVVAWRRSGTA